LGNSLSFTSTSISPISSSSLCFTLEKTAEKQTNGTGCGTVRSSGLFVCLFVGWLIGWLVGWLTGWLVGWLDGWLAGWLAGWLVGWLVGEG